jgi:LysM repeat protein
VKSGETLSKIAKDNKTTVDKILALNKSIKDPNKITIG